MPPRASLTSSFSVSDANNEVVCPLTNNDGSNCRKRCLGEKRYRSMQEHIRRAHPNHYIPKLPATEESFQLMVNTPPEQRSHGLPQPNTSHPRRGDPGDRDIFGTSHDRSSPRTPRTLDEAHPAAATAAVALAQLHHHRLTGDWDSEPDIHSDIDIRRDRMRSSIELPPLRDHFKQQRHQQDATIPPFQSTSSVSRPRELLPSILSHSPPGRSSTLPPIQRREKLQRSRKGSLTQSARRARHERNRSKEFGRRPSLNERKALSAEPQTAAWVQGKRWEDLIEAATSATEVDDRDLTPVSKSPQFNPFNHNVTSAPSTTKHRSSLPPAFQSSSIPGLPTPQPHYRQLPPPSLSYTASPLQKALTPPPYEPHNSNPNPNVADNDLEPFPSIESSLDSTSTSSISISTSISGKNFHMSSTGLASGTSNNSDSSPIQPPAPRPSLPSSSYNTHNPSSHPQQLQNHHHHHHHHHHQQQQQQQQQHYHHLYNPNHRPHHRLSNPTPLSSSSITLAGNKGIQIYCANCSRPWPVRDCFACTNCICGVCRECVSVVMGGGGGGGGLQTTSAGQPASILNLSGGADGDGGAGSGSGSGSGNGNGNGVRQEGMQVQGQGRKGCPHCGIMGGLWKGIQLDFR
ncbi:uncharacterized protein PADG_03754 [Paracoccidioides brasiliensis Pb18]|uniref:RING zinc finger-like domain-containing protein n=1 Tax=Paracoccidioides brasiliensis (strain Pb18) TaxID=502780 RepID=C1G918_PARBD|nr:uncharacterized protein PADG_03754 [Paracoccidioides brasiliensis Pb18]EEH47670.2 hypothetical protein PADG_03754 [Paracoccidioides brasiliensis Pb18]